MYHQDMKKNTLPYYFRNDLNYDDTLFNDHLKVIGCKAAYQNTSRNWKICETAEKIKAARMVNSDIYRNACTSAEVLTFEYEVF